MPTERLFVCIGGLPNTEWLFRFFTVTQVNLDDLEVQVQAIATDRHDRIGSYTAFILAIAAGLLLLVAVGGVWLGNSIVKPVLAIKKNLDNIAAGDGELTRRLPDTSNDELGSLSNLFNR